MEFKIGDIVEIEEGYTNIENRFYGEAIFKGQSTTDSKCFALERLDGETGGAQNSWWNFRKEGINSLKLVNKVDNKQTNMQKLNSMLKRLLSPDSQVLYKAGFIDGDLKLTSRGQEELNGIVFEANKTELVKLAQEQIVEDKEDK